MSLSCVWDLVGNNDILNLYLKEFNADDYHYLSSPVTYMYIDLMQMSILAQASSTGLSIFVNTLGLIERPHSRTVNCHAVPF